MIVVPTIHTAAILRGGGDDGSNLSKYLHVVKDDFRRAKELTQRKPNWDESGIWKRDPTKDAPWCWTNLFPPSVEYVYNFLERARNRPLSVDVECSGKEFLDCELICVGAASASGDVLNIPFMNGGGDYIGRYWSRADELRVREAFGWIALDTKTPKWFQNGASDTTVLWHEGMPVLNWEHDCYVESETEFLTSGGWKSYDAITGDMLLATINQDTGEMEFESQLDRIDKQYGGEVLIFETVRTRAVVTPNHRMWLAPYFRASDRTEPWQFKTARDVLSGSPDRYIIQTACKSDGRTAESVVYDGVEINTDFAILIGLFLTDGCLGRAKNKIDAGSVLISQKLGGRASSELIRLSNVITGSSLHVRHRPVGEAKRRIAIDEQRFSIHNKALAMWFEDHFGRYSRDRVVPGSFLLWPSNIRRALLHGLLLGDASEVDCGTEFRSTSRSLIDFVHALALSLGLPGTVHKCGGGLGLKLPNRPGWTGLLKVKQCVTTKQFSGRVVCFTVRNGTLVTRSRGKPAFYGNCMQLGHVFDPEMPQNLGYLASRCPTTELPFWKDDVKLGGQAWLDMDPVKLRSYNLRDCLVPLRAIPWYLAELKKLQLEDLYRTEMAEVHIMRKATWRGIEVDLDRRDSTEIVTKELLADPVKAARLGVSEKDLGLAVGLGPRMEKVQRDNLAILRGIAEHEDFNPNSHEQLTWFLYGKLKFPIVLRSQKTGKPSTDKNAMVLLALHAESATQKGGLLGLARYRKASKIINTNVRNLPILGDGRVHPSWKKLPVTGRFASSPNFQNFNAWIKRLYCSRRLRDGSGKLIRDKNGCYVFVDDFVSIDLNQAELRKMGYQSSDPDLLRMYEEGINVHTANTTLTFGIRCPPAANKKGDQLNPQTERYLREKIAELHQSMPDFFPTLYDDLPTYEGDPVFVKERWKGTRTLTKNETFGSLYGAIAQTLFDVLRSKRDQNTDELLFPDLELADVETFLVVWDSLHPALRAYQALICEHIQATGYYRSPLSGRVIWFRGGFERNKMLNYPTQEAISAHMSRIIEVNEYLEQLSGGGPLAVSAEHPIIVQQVHDSATTEGPKKYTEDIKEIFEFVFNRPYRWAPPPPFKTYENAILPADEPTVGNYLNEI